MTESCRLDSCGWQEQLANGAIKGKNGTPSLEVLLLFCYYSAVLRQDRHTAGIFCSVL